MAIIDGSLQLGYKNTAWFTANANTVLLAGQIVYLEQTGTYKLGDGVTALSALTFLGLSADGLTTNYIQKATGTDTIGNSSITDDGTDVIIGSSSLDAPSYYGDGSNAEIYVGSGVSTKRIKASVGVAALISGTKAIINADDKIVLRHDIIDLNAATINAPQLTASQIVETDASKNLVSAAKGTAYNKNFGTTAGTVLEGDKGLLIANNLSDLANFITARNANLRMFDLFLTAGNQTTTSNVASDITELVTPTLTANKRYKISGQILITCNGTGGVKFQVTVPTGATLSLGFTGNTTSQTAFGQYGVAASATLTPTALCTNSSFGTYINVCGEVSIGATAGTIQFGFASGTNTQTSTVYQRGTHLTVTQID